MRDANTVLAPSRVCSELGHGFTWVEVSAAGDRNEICADCSIARRPAHRAGSDGFADQFVQSVRRNEPLENLDVDSTIE